MNFLFKMILIINLMLAVSDDPPAYKDFDCFDLTKSDCREDT